MTAGTLYGIGIGPGDPELLTLKGARLLAVTRHVFVPKARLKVDSLALAIAERRVAPEAEIHEVVFPMSSDAGELHAHWQSAAARIAAVLQTGCDACFLTLGDPLLYSTYIYLVRALKEILPEAPIVTVPGVMAFAAAAALAGFPIGEGKAPVTIVPTSDDPTTVRRALANGGTVVLMKIGKRIGPLLAILEETGHIDNAVLVSRVGLDGQRVETDLRQLRARATEAEYLSVILVHAKGAEA